MKESSVNVTLGVGEIVKEVKDTKTIEEVDKTSALVVRAIHAALSPLEKWVLQKEYNLSETKKLLEEKLKDIPAEKHPVALERHCPRRRGVLLAVFTLASLDFLL